MADLQSLEMSVPLSVCPSVPLKALPAQSDVTSAISADFRHTVLKLTEVDSVPSLLPEAIAQRLAELWQRLVEVINKLRSLTVADAGSSDARSPMPQTPATLTPYVLEEIYDVLDILQTALPDKNLNLQAESLWQQYFLLETLAPWLLWGIASSAYEVMRLMEGITVKVFQPDQGWQTGILRLALLLDLKLDQVWSIDLATYQTPESLLPPGTLLQSDDCSVCQNPIFSEELLQRFTQAIATATPLGQFLEGAKTTVLIPDQNWRSGTLNLRLGFEFVPAIADEAADWVLSADSRSSAIEVTLITHAGEAVGTPFAISMPMLRFSQTDWQKQYQAAITKHLYRQDIDRQWGSLLPPFLTVDADPIPRLMQQAWEYSHFLETSLRLSSRNFLLQPLNLNDLLRRLLWCLSSSAFETMQFIGGISAELLQPQSHWTAGTLRLLASLGIQTDELDWHLDIATGQIHQPVAVLSAEAILRSPNCEWCSQPQMVSDLLDRVNQQIDRAVPELQLLRQGTSTDILISSQDWQPGTVRLNLDFVLTAH